MEVYNEYSAFDLEQIKNKIEKMNKQHHIEILKIFKKNASVKLNENKSGVFVNLSFLSKDVIEELNRYIDYISHQEDSIRLLENRQNEYKNKFFTEKEDKDNILLYNSNR